MAGELDDELDWFSKFRIIIALGLQHGGTRIFEGTKHASLLRQHTAVLGLRTVPTVMFYHGGNVYAVE